MSRTFAYCRVSTTEQATENQIIEIRNRGYDVASNRVVCETISGGVCAMERPAFCNLVTNKMESGDTLVVLKIDRLGRDNIDVQTTIQSLTQQGIKIVSLDLPTNDLTSSEGQLVLKMFTAFAEFERDRIKERTREGLARAKLEGKKLGRPAKAKREDVQRLKNEGKTQTQVADKLGLSISSVYRHWK